MLQNPCKTLGFKKNMVYKTPPGGGGKPYPASGLYFCPENCVCFFMSAAMRGSGGGGGGGRGSEPPLKITKI